MKKVVYMRTMKMIAAQVHALLELRRKLGREAALLDLLLQQDVIDGPLELRHRDELRDGHPVVLRLRLLEK
jgi:hypothetical protein